MMKNLNINIITVFIISFLFYPPVFSQDLEAKAMFQNDKLEEILNAVPFDQLKQIHWEERGYILMEYSKQIELLETQMKKLKEALVTEYIAQTDRQGQWYKEMQEGKHKGEGEGRGEFYGNMIFAVCKDAPGDPRMIEPFIQANRFCWARPMEPYLIDLGVPIIPDLIDQYNKPDTVSIQRAFIFRIMAGILQKNPEAAAQYKADLLPLITKALGDTELLLQKSALLLIPSIPDPALIPQVQSIAESIPNKSPLKKEVIQIAKDTLPLLQAKTE